MRKQDNKVLIKKYKLLNAQDVSDESKDITLNCYK